MSASAARGAGRRPALAVLASATADLRRASNDPALRARVDTLRAEYRALPLEASTRQAVEAAPPITADQRDRLAVILRGTRDRAAGAA